MALAINSFPVPLSPVIATVESLFPILQILFLRARITSDSPIMESTVVVPQILYTSIPPYITESLCLSIKYQLQISILYNNHSHYLFNYIITEKLSYNLIILF